MAPKRRRELSQWDKGQIEGRSESMMDAEIGRQLHIPRRTVSNFLTRIESRKTLNNLSRPGCPRTTKAQDKRIIAAAEINTRVPFAPLQKYCQCTSLHINYSATAT